MVRKIAGGAAYVAAALVSGLAVVSVSTAALAQSGPAPIKLLVGFPPGGSTDVLARIIAQEAGPKLGRDIIVINKAGATGAVAANEVASAPADGLTLGISPSATFTLSHLFQGIKPDLLERTEGLLQVGFQPIGIIVKTDSPWKSYKDLVAAARSQPGQVSLGIPGAGTTTDLLLQAMFRQDGIKVNLVTFRGDVPSATAVLGGHVAGTGISIGGAASHIEAGGVRLLLAIEGARSPVALDTPTARELGYDIAGDAIQYVYAPKGLGAAEKKRFVEVLGEVIRSATFVDIAKKNALFSATSMTTDVLDKHLLADRSRYTALVQQLGLGNAKQ